MSHKGGKWYTLDLSVVITNVKAFVVMWHQGSFPEVGEGVKRRPQTLSNALCSVVLYVKRLNTALSKSIFDAVV